MSLNPLYYIVMVLAFPEITVVVGVLTIISIKHRHDYCHYLNPSLKTGSVDMSNICLDLKDICKVCTTGSQPGSLD